MPTDQPQDDSRTIFEEQWRTYRKVIDEDFMDHAKIHQALSDYLGAEPRFSDSLGEMLDLGCGDAEISSALVGEFGCHSYLGVDASAMALEHASSRSRWAGIEPRFQQADLLGFLGETEAQFDLIQVGFVLHHLDQEAKRTFFQAIAERLRPGGKILFYDVFLRPGLDRERSVAAYLDWIRQDWDGITTEEYEAIAAHIESSDFPETVEWITEAARLAGLGEATRLVTCAENFHHALAFGVS